MRKCNPFHGACLDSGAQRSVLGLKQAKDYCFANYLPFKPKKSLCSFCFGDGTHHSLGKITIRIPTPGPDILKFSVDVIRPDVTLLIGLDLMDQEQIVPNNVSNKLERKYFGWSIPIIRKHGHMYINWNASSILFTRQELYHLHRHFHHPSSRNLLVLIKRSMLAHMDKIMKDMLDEISRSCETCQIYSQKPQRFKVSLPNEKTIFNREVSLDLMWLGGKAVLHILDIYTHFNSAAFLKGQTVEHVWDAFLSCWSTLYTGHPSKMKVD